MAWTGIARQEHSRKGLRYSSDMTDREWELAAPFIPPAKRGGRRRTTDMREVVNALLYIAASGCAWRLLPKCFPSGFYGPALFLCLAQHRPHGGEQHGAGDEPAGDRGTRSLSERWCDRQSVGENNGKPRPLRL